MVAVLVERGVLDYAAPVTKYWPEFGTHGKESITVGHVLSHTAGLPYLPADITVEQFADVATVTAWLAEQRPEWEPGTATGYHGWTYGHLVAEIARRATSRPIDDVLDEIATPLGIAGHLYFALPDGVPAATLYDGNWSAVLNYLPRPSTESPRPTWPRSPISPTAPRSAAWPSRPPRRLPPAVRPASTPPPSPASS
ncbi:serine hydrolase domain-containing protein [Nocardia nepalensis]|uniref:serine hydrolase domain-containing protein n=1 Tax=Nocardia nepalensis TaxID=3375448 RepID=UPI003B681567